MDDGGVAAAAAAAAAAVPRPARHRPAPMLPPPPHSASSYGPSAGVTPASLHSTSRSVSGATGIYHDPAVDELCRIETFQEDFNAKDFLAGLSERLIALSRADPGPFNPRPFIRNFEAAVESLQSLRRDLQEEQSTLASSVQVAQSAYTAKLHELASHFTSVSQSFSSLESRFSEVSRTAISIGEQLENIDRQKSRAVEAHDLIEHYYAFARGDTSKLERLRKEGGRQGRLKTAVIARRLGAISREVDVPGAEQTRETIDRYNERFERDMLKLFDKFYNKSNPTMMGHIAHVLQNFNGGHSCVQSYVNQHDFFISKDRVGEASRMENSHIWATLADPDAYPPQSEPSLAALFDEIRTVVEAEAQIIAVVFPNPLMVMSTFLQRVFAQSVQGYIEVLMAKAAEVGAGGVVRTATASANAPGDVDSKASLSDLAFLRVLQMARSMSLALIADLKAYDFRGPGGAPSHKNDAAAASASPGIGGILDGGGGDGGVGIGGTASALTHGGAPLAYMLDSAVEEIFVPYMEGIKYLERESKSLTDLYAASLARFAQFHRNTSKVKTSTIFDRVRAAAGSSSSASAAAGSPATSATALQPLPTKTSAFSKLSGFVDRARGAVPAASALPDEAGAGSTDNVVVGGMGGGAVDATGTPILSTSADPIEENDGELSLAVAERMLRWHAEAIGRCVDLSQPSDVGKNVFALLKVLAEAFLKSYLETGLDSALALVAAQDVRSPTLPDLAPLRVVRQVELITSLWQHYVSVALIPLTGSSVTLRREMAIFNNHNLLRVEGKCDALVQRIVDNVVAFLSARLATQKRNDYAPKNDELAFSRMNTDPCMACCDALERTARAVRAALVSPRNVEAVLSEVGVALHSLLLDHFKKYTVSAAGGLMLTKDLAAYQDAVALFGQPALNDRFEMLRSLGNLFIVQPAVLKGYMREGHLSKIDERLLHAFLLRRSDYAKEVRDLEDARGRGGAGGGGVTAAGGVISWATGGGGGGGGGSSTHAHATQHGGSGGGSVDSTSSSVATRGNGRLSMMLHDLERFAAGGGGGAGAGTGSQPGSASLDGGFGAVHAQGYHGMDSPGVDGGR